MSSGSRSGNSVSTWLGDSPAANNSRTSVTRIRIPRMQGRPPHCSGFTVMRSAISVMTLPRYHRWGIHALLRVLTPSQAPCAGGTPGRPLSSRPSRHRSGAESPNARAIVRSVRATGRRRGRRRSPRLRTTARTCVVPLFVLGHCEDSTPTIAPTESPVRQFRRSPASSLSTRRSAVTCLLVRSNRVSRCWLVINSMLRKTYTPVSSILTSTSVV